MAFSGQYTQHAIAHRADTLRGVHRVSEAADRGAHESIPLVDEMRRQVRRFPNASFCSEGGVGADVYDRYEVVT